MQGVRALCDKYGILMICRRGDVRLRPHRRVVRHQSLERRPRHHHDGEGADERVRAARRGRHPAEDRRSLQEEAVSGRPDLQQPSARLRDGAGDDRGDRGGRPRRAGAADGPADGGAARPTWRRGIRRSAPSDRSACSASSSWCATADAGADGAVQRHVAGDGGARRSSSAQEGLYTFVRWNYFFTNPPLPITEAELREGFAIISRALAITDKSVVG